MDEKPEDPFHSGGHFHKVIALHEKPGLTWDELAKLAPLLPRGWFELSQLPVSDRIEFTCDFWCARLPFAPTHGSELQGNLIAFFENLEDIGIYVTQSYEGLPCDVHMVYSLKDNLGFFQGEIPALESKVDSLKRQFGNVIFPPDYLAFLQIHDGFSKYADTGLIKSNEMAKTYQRFQSVIADEVVFRPDGQILNPKSLIPFYESYGLHCYQCFYSDWIPDQEMGNFYFSEHELTVCNFFDRSHLEENLAFPTFLEWLEFYLKDIWHL